MERKENESSTIVYPLHLYSVVTRRVMLHVTFSHMLLRRIKTKARCSSSIPFSFLHWSIWVKFSILCNPVCNKWNLTGSVGKPLPTRAKVKNNCHSPGYISLLARFYPTLSYIIVCRSSPYVFAFHHGVSIASSLYNSYPVERKRKW